jgi:hypothetical protein
MSREPLPEWLKLEKARKITGHETHGAWEKWLHRWNLDNPTMLVMVRPGYVELNSLRAALNEQAARYTPGYGAAQAHVKLDTQKRARA